MEDPSGESEIDEDLGDEGNTSCGTVRWIMNKGLGIGKKVLLTGMVISSAPLLLPPLVVISAIGFACCVPSGVVLASYACTEKLMNKWLPYGTTSPPLLLEDDETLMSNDEEVGQDDEEHGTWCVGGKIDTEKEERWDRGDILEGGDELRIEFIEEENDEFIEEGRVEEGDKDVKKNGQEYVTKDVSEIVEENGCYQEGVAESLDEEENLISENINGVNVEVVFEDYTDDTFLDENPAVYENPAVSEVYGLVSNVSEGDEEIGVTPIEVTTIVMDESEGQERMSDIAEEEELVEETRGLLEKIRDEGNVDNAMEMGDEEIGVAPIEVTTIVMDESEGQERVNDIAEEAELVEETRGLLEKTRDEGNVDTAREMGEEEIGVAPIAVTPIEMEESEGEKRASDIAEEEELVEETTGLLEKLGDEGLTDSAMEYVAAIEEVKDVGDQHIGGNVEHKIGDVGLNKPTGTMEGGVEEVPKECGYILEFQEMRYVNDTNTVSEDVKPTGDIGSVSESNHADNNLEADKPFGETKKFNNSLQTKKRNLRPVVSSIMEDKQKSLIKRDEIPQGGRAEDHLNDLDFGSTREKETVVSTNASRAIADESRHNLFDEKNVTAQQYQHASHGTSEGHVGKEGADFAELPVSHSKSTDTGISSEKDFIMHSNVALYDEAKMWKQIKAMRNIVGYKGTPHATCIEEVKALYLFTGVEPPASFSDHPDLAQVNDKLRFLMTIIGVKVD